MIKFWLRALRFILVQPLLPAAPARRQPMLGQPPVRQRPAWETPAYLRKLRSGDRAWMRY